MTASTLIRSTLAPAPRTAAKVLIWAFVAFDVFLLVFILGSSFKDTASILGSPWAPPTSLIVSNWSDAWSSAGFGRAALNSFGVVAAATITTTAIAAPAGFVLARTAGRIAGATTVFFIAGMGIPAQIVVIPLFIILAHVGLVNSLLGLYLVFVGISTPFAVFLLTGFLGSIPTDILEAASIDGASRIRSFISIVIPVGRAGIVTALILTAISLWNETLISLVLLQSDEKFTLPVALLNFFGSMQFTGASYGVLFAGVAIMILPILLVYAWLGRRIVEGMTLGIGR